MSTANTTPHFSVQKLIEQRLDAIDQALLGLLPRHERLAAVSQVESQIRERVAANPAITDILNAPAQEPQFTAMSPGGWNPAAAKKRSRLAVTAGVAGIVALVLLFISPVTYFIVEFLGEALGEFIAIAILGTHLGAVAVCGFAAVGLGIGALLSLRRRKGQLAGHGWAITGLCTGPLPMLAGGAAVLFFGLQLGLGAFVTTSAAVVADDNFTLPSAPQPADGSEPVENSFAPHGLPQPAQPYFSPLPVQPAGHEVRSEETADLLPLHNNDVRATQPTSPLAPQVDQSPAAGPPSLSESPSQPELPSAPRRDPPSEPFTTPDAIHR